MSSKPCLGSPQIEMPTPFALSWPLGELAGTAGLLSPQAQGSSHCPPSTCPSSQAAVIPEPAPCAHFLPFPKEITTCCWEILRLYATSLCTVKCNTAGQSFPQGWNTLLYQPCLKFPLQLQWERWEEIIFFPPVLSADFIVVTSPGQVLP